MKNKIICIITCILCLIMILPVYAAWTYNSSVELQKVASLSFMNWEFYTDPITTEGTIVIVGTDGTVLVNDEVVEAQVVTYNDNSLYNRGEVSLTIETNEDGELVLTEFTTTNSSWTAFFGSEVYLPTSLNIDGTIYPIVGIDQPLQIDLGSSWFGLGSSTVNIPDTYTYICDGAFASITTKATFNMPTSIVSIGSGAFMPARNTTQTISYKGTQAQWNAINKASNYENGQGSITINYNS